ncbi:MAG TPA: ComEA family DNA-binding protein [Bacteroidota bacterium]|nr:ComEA family DNA-binding protein [Bacteroidota bacterium]
MKAFDKFNRAIGFTQTESRVVVFLVASLVLGLGIKVVKDTMLQPAKFDYAAADSEFAARSRLVDAEPAADSASSPDRIPDFRPDDDEVHLVDINTATLREFIPLPGIGEKMAARIVDYRKEHGRFSSVDDLRNVKGIGAKKLEQLRTYCTTGKH